MAFCGSCFMYIASLCNKKYHNSKEDNSTTENRPNVNSDDINPNFDLDMTNKNRSQISV